MVVSAVFLHPTTSTQAKNRSLLLHNEWYGIDNHSEARGGDRSAVETTIAARNSDDAKITQRRRDKATLIRL